MVVNYCIYSKKRPRTSYPHWNKRHIFTIMQKVIMVVRGYSEHKTVKSFCKSVGSLFPTCVSCHQIDLVLLVFECWKYNTPGFVEGWKFKFSQWLTAARLVRKFSRIFESHRNMFISVLHRLWLTGRIFGFLTLAHELSIRPPLPQTYDSGAPVLQHFVIIMDWFSEEKKIMITHRTIFLSLLLFLGFI